MRVLDKFLQGWVKRLRDRRTAVALDDAGSKNRRKRSATNGRQRTILPAAAAT